MDVGSVGAACNFSLNEQGLLAGLIADTPGMEGKPIESVENACASGGQAVLSVIQKLQLGMGETGIAVGYEKMRDAEGKMDGKLIGKVLGYFSHPDERAGKVFVFPHIFAEVMREYMDAYGVTESDLAAIAEESTDWPGVSRPTSMGGLGFTFKWNMGWMHDTLSYVEHDPVHRRFHHDELTFSLVYAWDENFVLPLSHDEVVHGKRSLLSKLPGDRWQQLATLRALYGLMWSHPGKQSLFMGGELAEWGEWSEGRSLDWALLDDPDHAGVRALVCDLNATYRAQPALWEIDFRPEGFVWLVGDARDENVIAFARFASDGGPLVSVVNFSPVVRDGWRLPLPCGGRWVEALNTDSRFYAGSDVGNGLGVEAEASPLHGQPFSAVVTLPPLGTIWLVPAR